VPAVSRHKAQKLRRVVTVGGDSYSNDLGVWANARLEAAD